MSTPHFHRGGHGPDSRPDWRNGHVQMLLACCAATFALAGLLVLTGARGVGFIVYAVLYVAMLAVMPFGGSGGHGGHGRS